MDYETIPDLELPTKSHICPICALPAVEICECDREGCVCENKHSWYTLKGIITIGNAHEETENELDRVSNRGGTENELDTHSVQIRRVSNRGGTENELEETESDSD